MKRAKVIFDTLTKINNRKNPYEGTLERILKAWQKEGAMPENAPRCVQKYVIEGKDKDKFYTAFEQIVSDQLAEKNTENMDRLLQVFTQAKNQEINSKVIKIVEQVVQKDLASKNKSNLKKDPELAKKLLEIIKNNFAYCFADQDEAEETNQQQVESKEPLLNKETKNKTEKSSEKNEDWSAEDIFTYQTLLALLSLPDKDSDASNKEATLISPSSSEANPDNPPENFIIEEVKLVGSSSLAHHISATEEQKD